MNSRENDWQEDEAASWGSRGKWVQMLLSHFGIILRSQPARPACSWDRRSSSLPLTGLFLQLDAICFNAEISPAKVRAVCSDVGHILIII